MYSELQKLTTTWELTISEREGPPTNGTLHTPRMTVAFADSFSDILLHCEKKRLQLNL